MQYMSMRSYTKSQRHGSNAKSHILRSIDNILLNGDISVNELVSYQNASERSYYLQIVSRQRPIGGSSTIRMTLRCRDTRANPGLISRNTEPRL